jgi:hypothetical protein
MGPRALVGSGAACLVLVLAALTLGTADSANAQFYPFWGGWQGPPPWVPRHRAPHGVLRPPSKDETPDRSSALPAPKGPVLIVVSISRQHITVYDGDQQIATAPISSGMPGRPTPTGIFSVMEKDLYHESNIYSGAPMPHMERIAFSGIALHGGVLPGYPASHGCIRLPYDFARNLFGITQLATRVIVANDDLRPTSFSNPWLMAPLPPDDPATDSSTLTTAAAGERPRTRGMAAAARAAEREQLAVAVASAETAKTTAIAAVKPATDAARAAESEVGSAKSEAERLTHAVAQAKDAASSAKRRFADLMDVSAKLDPAKLDPDALKREAGNEVTEETKVMDLLDAAEAAKGLAAKQVEAVKAAAVRASAAEAARRSAIDEKKKTEIALADAQAAVAAADRLEARKNLPVSVLISAKTGRLNPAAALARIQIPKKTAEKLAELVKPGSSFIVTDLAPSRETGKGTDFIVGPH